MIETILKEDGYRRIRISEVVSGDLAVYWSEEEVSHTAVVVNCIDSSLSPMLRAVWVLSKWGQQGEYLHKVDVCPFREDDIQYWTDRR